MMGLTCILFSAGPFLWPAITGADVVTTDIAPGWVGKNIGTLWRNQQNIHKSRN